MFRGLRRGFLDRNRPITARFRNPLTEEEAFAGGLFGALTGTIPNQGDFLRANLPLLRRLYRQLQNSQIRIQYFGEGGTPVYETRGVINITTFGKFKDTLYIYEPDVGEGWLPEIFGYEGYVRFLRRVRVRRPDGDYQQVFREGVTNCVLKPIKLWLDTLSQPKTQKAGYNKLAKFEKKYPNGIPPYALDEVARALNININILAPFSKRVLKQGTTNKIKARKTFNLDNTYQNHVSLEDPRVVELAPEVMAKWKLERYDMYHDSPNKDKTRSIYKVRRGDTIYEVARDQAEIDFYKQVKDYGFDSSKHPKLQQFISNSVHYTGCINFIPAFKAKQIIEARTCHHIDQKASYASFRQCPGYKGFMGRPAFFARTNILQGIGIYLIDNIQYTHPKIQELNNRLGFLSNNNSYPSPFLQWLNQNGVTFDILGGCWGSRIDFDFPACMVKDGSYAIWAGCCDSTITDKSVSIHKADKNWLASVEEKVVRCSGGDCQILLPKKYKAYKGHLTSFMVAYSYIQTFSQLLKFDTLDQIVRVIGDGIYYCGDMPELVGSFTIKEKDNDFRTGGSDCDEFFSRLTRADPEGWDSVRYIKSGTGAVTTHTITDLNGEEFTYKRIDNGINKWGFQEYTPLPDFIHEKQTCLKSLDYIDYHLKNPCLWSGPGGYGKSYTAMHVNWLIDPIFLFPCHDLRQDFEDNYPGIRTMTHQRLLGDYTEKKGGEDVPKWKAWVKGCSVAIIDEGSMINSADMKKMYDRLKSVGIFTIVIADLEYQLEPITGRPCQARQFASIKEFLIDHRSVNQITKDKKELVRELMRKGYSLKQIIEKVVDTWGNTDEYQKDDIIIAGRHIYCDEHTEKFKYIEKYRVEKGFQGYNTGQILFEKPVTKQEGVIKKRHGFTIHSVQGKTTERKLYIDTRKMTSRRMFYTAVSRCRDWASIVFLK